MEYKTATQMATIYGMKSPQAFNKLLAQCGVLTNTIKGYVLADSLRGQGYTIVIDKPYFLPNGIKATKKKSAWTESGQQFIRQRLGRLGIVPLSDQRDMFTTNA